MSGKNSVEKGLAQRLKELNMKLDHLFVSRKVGIKVKPKEKEDVELDERGFEDKTTERVS